MSYTWWYNDWSYNLGQKQQEYTQEKLISISVTDKFKLLFEKVKKLIGDALETLLPFIL